MRVNAARDTQQAATLSSVVVVGTGPAGLIAALAIAAVGGNVHLAGPHVPAEHAHGDPRTTALFGASIDLLKDLDLWDRLAARAEPLKALRLIDDSGGWARVPEILFRAGEAGKDAFGYNLQNSDLVPALAEAVREHAIQWHPAFVETLHPINDRVRLRLTDGSEHEAALVVGADGRLSKCRTAMGAQTRTWCYPQTALVTQFAHSRPHHGVSTEFHRRAGPLTTVPMSGNRSSLVWVETPEEAARLKAMTCAGLSSALEERLQGLLGTLSDVGPRATFPLSGLTAEPMAASRIALIGEAAHVLPPIGAQGLNLGFRDAAWLAHAVKIATHSGEDIGGTAVMRAYNASRQNDILLRSAMVDVLNRSLIAGFAPFDFARQAGLLAVATVPWLRRLAMEGGIGPETPLPTGDRWPGT